MIDNKSSDCFWCIKAFSILTIFYAHCGWTGDSVTGKVIYESIGSFGVPLFMLISGFFDAKSHASIVEKIKRLFIPLVLWGALTYCIRLYCLVRLHIDPTQDHGIFLGFIKWIYGCSTWYYFIAVLFWCQLLVRGVNVWLLAVLGVCSMILTSMDIIPYNEIFTPYNNPFNLIVYFIIGRVYRLRKGDEIVVSPVAACASAFFVVVFLLIFKIPYYWNPMTPLFTIALFALLWFIFYRDDHYNATIKLGKLSMVIYLCHMQFAQALASRVCSFLGGGFLGNIVKVPIAIVFVVALVYLLEMLLIKTNQNKILRCLGYR